MSGKTTHKTKLLQKLQANKKKIETKLQEETKFAGKYQDMLSRIERLEHILLHEHSEHLAEAKFWRPLTEFENEAVINYLADNTKKIEEELQAEFQKIMEQVDKNIQKQEKAIDKKELTALLLYIFLRKRPVKEILDKTIKDAYDTGKNSASKELNIERPATPTVDSTYIAYQRDELTNAITQDINATAKMTILEGITKNIPTPAIIIAVQRIIKDKLEKTAKNIAGSTVPKTINQARSTVFEEEEKTGRIIAYKRSEILDAKTCNMCLSLDGRIVKADDPISKMDIMHNKCRGIWISIISDMNIDGRTIGVPKSITSNMETIGGVPITNAFEQLKKPIKKEK